MRLFHLLASADLRHLVVPPAAAMKMVLLACRYAWKGTSCEHAFPGTLSQNCVPYMPSNTSSTFRTGERTIRSVCDLSAEYILQPIILEQAPGESNTHTSGANTRSRFQRHSLISHSSELEPTWQRPTNKLVEDL